LKNMKIYLDTLGCKLNQSEIENMARQFRMAGHEIVASAEGAELAVVNTCTVTSDAAADSRGRVRHLAHLGVKEIIATGCWSTLQPEEAAKLPNVLRVVPNNQKDNLVSEILNFQPFDCVQGEPLTLRLRSDQAFNLRPSSLDINRLPIPGPHHRTRAFIKVQDGCDNHCTFCIAVIARGTSRSRAIADVLSDVRFALAGGTKEIVLTGVHLGSWGQEFNAYLYDLVKAILRETDTPRLRLSSLEPWDLDEDFFSLWDPSTSLRTGASTALNADKRLMPHLHLPLQSGSLSNLKRMARKTTPESFRRLISAARERIPDVAVTTDIIAGFLGETDEEFAESLAFIREMDFADGHVFTYSPRPGTAAARMKGQVRFEVRKERNHILRAAFDESAKSYRQKFIGRMASVLWESATEVREQGWQMQGHAENHLRVSALAPSPRWNEIDKVELIEISDEGMKGVIHPKE
jgi:threonylcarbamoyladenosine tRNA methylthiotransferase MtaB